MSFADFSERIIVLKCDLRTFVKFHRQKAYSSRFVKDIHIPFSVIIHIPFSVIMESYGSGPPKREKGCLVHPFSLFGDSD